MKPRWWQIPLKAMDKLLDRIFSILGAFILVQFPQFYSQYLQRLGGHLDEARRMVGLYTNTANSLHLTLNQFIETHLLAENPVFISSGEQIGQMVERFYKLENSFTNLSLAKPISRLWVFFREADWEIAGQVGQSFTPGIPTNLEGALYALLGLCLGWGLYSLLKILVHTLSSFLQEKKQTKEEYTFQA